MHDFLIVGTGFNVDPALIPELASYTPNIATWYDAIGPHLISAATIWRGFLIWVPVSN